MASVCVAVRVEKRYSALLEGPTGYYPLESLRFLNGKVGWAVGSAQILKTLNGGRSWTNHYPQQFSEDSLSPEVACPVDPYICWLLAYRGNQHLRCLVTRDSGCTWSEKYRLPPSFYA